jgi:hypothetical protein
MTPVAMPVIVVLMQFYPGAGTAVPAPRQGNPAVMSTFFTMEDCNRYRVSRGHSEDYFCLEYKSDKIIDYTFPADKQRQGSIECSGCAVGPLALKDEDRPFIEPLVETIKQPLDITPKESPKAKRVARKQQPSDPVGSLVAFFTPRDW